MDKGQMNDVLKVARELGKSSVLETIKIEMKKKQEEKNKELKQIKNPYSPRKNTLEKLSEYNPELEMELMNLNPYSRVFLRTIDKHYYKFINTSYKMFPAALIQRMTVPTRLKVIEYASNGVRETLRGYRDKITSSNFMFQDKYEEKRMEYLIKHGKEPICIKEKDYQYFEDVFNNMFKKVSKIYFDLNGNNEITKNHFSKYDCEEYMVQIFADYLRKSAIIHESVLRELKDYFLKRLYTAEENPIFKNYDEYKIKPLSNQLVFEKEEKYFPRKNSLKDFKFIAIHLENLKELDSPEEIFQLCSAIVNLLHDLDEKIEGGCSMDKINESTRSGIYPMIKNLPQIVKILEELNDK